MKRINEESAIVHYAFFILIFALMFFGTVAFGQKYQRNGNQFSVNTEKVKDLNTGYTYKDKQGKVYPIYQNSKGNFYIIRKSKKTGKQYKSYLPKEISAEIAKELN
jgi:hypothetical protein